MEEINNTNSTKLFVKKSVKKQKSISKKISKKNSSLTKSSSKKSQVSKTISTIILTSKNIHNFLPTSSKYEIVPQVWELPNRKRFNDWVLKTFDEVYDKVPDIESTPENPNPFNPKIVQRLIHDFMRGSSPYRGLLLYYGLGVGKTCSALAISEAVNTLQRVVFMSKAALELNFKKEVKFCGAEYMRHINHWVFCNCDTDAEIELAGQLGITQKMIDQNGGAFLIDYSKSQYPNYNYMPSSMKTRLNQQIDAIMASRFKFIHTDDNSFHHKITQEDFNNSVIIIDEVHNLINTMTSGKSRGQLLYDFFMNANNSKFVLLTATPLINRVFESSRLFNILRGYMPYLEIRLKASFDTVIDYNDIKYNLILNKYVDQVHFNRIKKLIKISRNPENFINSSARSNPGLVYSPKDNITDEEFKTIVEKIIAKYGYEFSINEGVDRALPDDENEFERHFYNVELNKMKKKELFKRRIAGLTSYYGYLDPKLFPVKIGPHIQSIPMSDYQQTIYEKYRHNEISDEKKKVNKKQMNNSQEHLELNPVSLVVLSFQKKFNQLTKKNC